MAANPEFDKHNPQAIGAKWQKRWEETGLYATVEDPARPKHYALTMLPYTSGDLHIGHWYAMAPSDAKARFMRMNGYNTFFPVGFDAFGLPAENAAIQRGIHPFKWTMDNVARMRGQLRSMGAMWAWDREAVSCLPGYYKWTQWFFLKFYERDLAYRKKAPVDFCPKCNTTLAREQVWGDDRHCERCGTPVVKKELEQWFFRITNYADELLSGLDKIEWPERVKTMQRNWIGRSEGARVAFRPASSSPLPISGEGPVASSPSPLPGLGEGPTLASAASGGVRAEPGDTIEVFTTRPDTLWGATFMVLAPEHPLVEKLTPGAHWQAVQAYQYQASRQSEIERLSTEKEKTGVFTGAYAINPVNGVRIPIWIADYVMMGYGTGAIMGVPAHDARDFAFALKYGLPIIPVIARVDGRAKSIVRLGSVREGLGAALAEASIPYEEREGALYVALQGEAQLTAYVELVGRDVLPQRWVEVAGAGWLFIFDNGALRLDSMQADRDILARCRAIMAAQGGGEPAMEAARTTMELLYSQAWYRDILIHEEYGAMIASSRYTGTPGERAVAEVTEWLKNSGVGGPEVNYRLRDWLISRQRYWGAPIPMVYCEQCGTVPVPYEQLPVLLPEDAEFMPTGESPLKYHPGFLNTTCPKCGGPAQRETDTMDTFMCSSWYHYAYISPYYQGEVPFDQEKGKYWLPVDQYTGGIEHATMHLMYTRFFTKVLRDIGLVDFDEPMLRLFTQGIILGEDNEKMSKSRGNVVNPDDYVATLGADAVRAFLMFIGPWDLGGSWSSTGIEGIHRFINRLWTVILEPRTECKAETCQVSEDLTGLAELRRMTHKTIQRVTGDIQAFKFNTALAALMEFNNYLVKAKETDVYGSEAWDEATRSMILMCAPLMPHVTEELWERIGGAYSVHTQAWPPYDAALAADEVITLVVQVNGRVRGRLSVAAGIAEEEAKAAALADPSVFKYVEGKEVRKVVVVPGRLVNIVVG